MCFGVKSGRGGAELGGWVGGWMDGCSHIHYTHPDLLVLTYRLTVRHVTGTVRLKPGRRRGTLAIRPRISSRKTAKTEGRKEERRGI